jgi:hypothetical protein
MLGFFDSLDFMSDEFRWVMTGDSNPIEDIDEEEIFQLRSILFQTQDGGLESYGQALPNEFVKV